MDAKARRRGVALVGLIVILAVVVWWQFGRGTEATRLAPAPRAAVRPGRSPAPSTTSADLRVHVDLLDRARPSGTWAGRDPFRFGGGEPPPSAAAEAVPSAAAAGTGQQETTMGPVAPPPPPPIPYRFIGVLTTPGGGRVAVLSDGRFVYYGRQGDIIEGRYRIVSVGDQVVEMEYLDGSGRQVIRLSGS